ncbi:2-hexaprenyl-6-methoxy-1,4-benzoquinone methyltransferase [Boothiomyces sp. JEL0838]|nr:2-hexaprenyl-6-methoxy-1,4-benzoquinone methyltransferase [Boothiomyces sp. JEL0838]
METEYEKNRRLNIEKNKEYLLLLDLLPRSDLTKGKIEKKKKQKPVVPTRTRSTRSTVEIEKPEPIKPVVEEDYISFEDFFDKETIENSIKTNGHFSGPLNPATDLNTKPKPHWSKIKQASFKQFKTNPNSFHYRHCIEEQRMGDWTEQEHLDFINLIKQYGAGDLWDSEILLFGDPLIDQIELKAGQIYEIFGSSGTGKTCFALQASLRATMPTDKGGLNGQIHVLHTRNSHILLHLLKYIIPPFVKKKNIKMRGIRILKRFNSTHFGFRQVDVKEKESLVKNVFESVAPSYDIMNDVMSGGIHRLWKDYFISKLSPTNSTKLLDVAGGTGDIAFRFIDKIRKEYGTDPDVRVLDINENMLQVGRERAKKKGYELEFVQGNAEELQFENDTFDAYTIAFGIRNCTHVDRVLSEAYRVLKPGGRFMCLEFSHVESPLIKAMYDMHSFYMIPKMGELIANDRESYQYLVESIRKFPKQTEFAEMIRNAGFKTVGDGYENLTFGVAAIHSGYKL